MAGEYARLIVAFHADTDPGRYQLAAAEISRIAPLAGSDMAGADQAAAAVLAKLYPQEA